MRGFVVRNASSTWIPLCKSYATHSFQIQTFNIGSPSHADQDGVDPDLSA